MLTPRTLKVRGFRGFLNEQEFRFDTPVVILFGENHSGKSSTLNALEWCLFGDECKGIQTGIRERVGWIVPNRHLDRPDVLVELTLDGPDGTYRVCRRLYKAPKKTTLVEELEVCLPDGKPVEREKAEQQLTRLLGCSSRDFMTTVYQHQETIRGIVIEKPKERNEAIDRLLGLSGYTNLLSGINDASLQRRHKKIGKDFEDFETRVQDILAVWEKELNAKRQEAGVIGNRLTGSGTLAAAREVQQSLKAFAERAGLEPVALELPAGWQSLPAFEKSAKQILSELRAATPDLQEQQRLLDRRKELARLQSDYESARTHRDNIGKKTRELDTEHGGRKAVTARIASMDQTRKAEEARRRAIDALAALIEEAINYLERSDEDGPTNRCPVCETEAPNLLATLSKKLETARQGQLNKIGDKIEGLKRSLEALSKIDEAYEKLDKQLARLVEELSTARREIGELLGKELTDADDPLALLKSELAGLAHRLKQLSDAVQEKQAALQKIEEDLDKVHTAREILQLAEKKQFADRIQESPEYQALEAARDRLALFVADVEAVKSALLAASSEEAHQKLTAAERAIDEYFRQLTRSPDVRQIQLKLNADARGRNAYDITDQDGNDLTPILSQGDLNALALAVFLGLASCSAAVSGFGFVLLDDPSQSLGSEHKKQLCKILDRVCDTRRVLLATMDREFYEYLRDGLTKAKTEYTFGAWTAENGVRVGRR